MTRTAQRLAALERRAAPPARQLIIVRRVRAEDGSPLAGRVVTHDGAPTAGALAAVARLEAEGYAVPYGIEGGHHVAHC